MTSRKKHFWADEEMAREAANCYSVLCMLERDEPLLDLFNQMFLERQLQRYAKE